VVEFRDNDAGYLEWLRSHSNGYVLNHERKPSPRYLKLHRANCWSIGGTPSRGRRWTHAYVKQCAVTVEELRNWAREVVGANVAPCPHCMS
jgi:hypothetical protein